MISLRVSLLLLVFVIASLSAAEQQHGQHEHQGHHGQHGQHGATKPDTPTEPGDVSNEEEDGDYVSGEESDEEHGHHSRHPNPASSPVPPRAAVPEGSPASSNPESPIIALAGLPGAGAPKKAPPAPQPIPCSENSQCTASMGPLGGCHQGHCACAEGSGVKPDQGICVTNTLRAIPGQMCSSDKECEIRDSACRDGRCQCNMDFILSSDKVHCLPLAQEIGWGCEEDAQCTTLLNRTTECRDKTCSCRSGTQLKDGKCVEGKGLNGYCESSAVCLVDNSECIQGVCACSSGHVTAADSARCLKVAEGYKARCEEEIQCSQVFGEDGAVCKKDQCVCKPNFHFAEMRCWKDKGLQEVCERTAECYIASDGSSQKLECRDRQCSCREGFETNLEDMRCDGSLAAVSALLLILCSAAWVA